MLNAIYEEGFFGFSYGNRPKRSQHDALDALIVGVTSKKVNYILDADVRSCFDLVSQDWLIRFLMHGINDPRMIRLPDKRTESCSRPRVSSRLEGFSAAC